MNPKTIAYQEMMKMFEEQFGKAGPEMNSDSIGRRAGCDDCSANIEEREEHKDFLTYWYLHQLEEEVKRLEGKRKPSLTPQVANKIGTMAINYKWNSALDSEIALCEEAIKEIKALQ